MGFLNPLFLLAGVAALVPVILHLFYRQESKTFTFPAIRYLLRTEKDHARQIRTQQLLLLLVRVAIVLLLVVLGARIHFPGPGGSHDPTAVALVLDNSLSTTIIEEGQRRLDTLKAIARKSVEAAGYDDVIWVVRAGSPWEVAVPGGIEQAAIAIEETGPSHAHGDLSSAIGRARALVGQSSLPGREVHVFTDLQATAFSRARARRRRDSGHRLRGAGRRTGEPGYRRSLDRRWPSPPAGTAHRRGRSRLRAARPETPSASGSTSAARCAPPHPPPQAQPFACPSAPSPPGASTVTPRSTRIRSPGTTGRFFSFTVRDPTPVAVLGPAPFFLTEALAVLQESDRISLGGAARAATLISLGGEGLERRSAAQSVVVVPLADPARLPALNRRLAEAGVPYRYESGPYEGARILRNDLPVDLENLEIRRFFRVVPVASDGGEDGTGALLSTGDPWLLAGSAPTGPYILLSTPMDEQSTSLPVSAAMIPLLEWMIERWFGDGTSNAAVTAGMDFRPPPTASAVRGPDGIVHQVDGDQPFLATAAAGIYHVLAGDSILESIPVNPPAAETDLTPASRGEVRRTVPGTHDIVDDAAAWSRHIFRAGRGPEPWRPLAATVLVLLVLETAVAASRALRTRRSGGA